jgi:hypothetical protein
MKKIRKCYSEEPENETWLYLNFDLKYPIEIEIQS